MQNLSRVGKLPNSCKAARPRQMGLYVQGRLGMIKQRTATAARRSTTLESERSVSAPTQRKFAAVAGDEAAVAIQAFKPCVRGKNARNKSDQEPKAAAAIQSQVLGLTARASIESDECSSDEVGDSDNCSTCKDNEQQQEQQEQEQEQQEQQEQPQDSRLRPSPGISAMINLQAKARADGQLVNANARLEARLAQLAQHAQLPLGAHRKAFGQSQAGAAPLPTHQWPATCNRPLTPMMLAATSSSMERPHSAAALLRVPLPPPGSHALRPSAAALPSLTAVASSKRSASGGSRLPIRPVRRSLDASLIISSSGRILHGHLHQGCR